ncbi:hypothetical protein DSO57_1031411 [Entomophthora muscae]|uniref:Uncharacterized protein n=1 Tax=Entomophthora muscae TaxID=34485 RepID=A0ACC2RRS3_9FUNG|nr:hypothetical protein DSO57_1031411 [Entomophthora muscae]
MKLWFEKILPYQVLVIFHLNSSQVDHQATTPSGDQPVDPSQALFCPPGAPFGPVHFNKYPPNPAYAEYNLKTIPIADPLARTRENEYIGREGKSIEVPPLLFKEKYNYLCAYFFPMTLPLTLRPDHQIESPAAAKTTSTQLFKRNASVTLPQMDLSQCMLNIQLESFAGGVKGAGIVSWLHSTKTCLCICQIPELIWVITAPGRLMGPAVVWFTNWDSQEI